MANCKTTATHKWCPGCRQNLPHKAFSKSKTASCGLQGYCKKCQEKRRRERIATGKLEYTPGQKQEYNLRKYNLTLADFDEMLARQGGRCAICGTDELGHRGRFCVDHDHETGKTRALLYSKCNTGLGMFKDSTDNLQRALDYLNNFQGEE